ncbi:uncharacterized protein DEA37_0015247 [Paragonimus westermani]|uniref:Uncharacterized protein n=1 Tax=Paragonimus westermani TaxID=34504 RepID=A0A5J4P1Z8_9TREM|nr:uncharacterized protein DEA37_0015247 [Paragonimus westermani]
MFVPSLKEAEEKKKKNPKEEFSQIDILLIVALILAFVLSLLAIVLEPQRIHGNTMAEEAVTIVGFIILTVAVVIRLILLCACEKKFRALSISVIVLTAVGFVLFVVATSLSFMITPPYGSWAIAGSAMSLLSLLNSIFLYLMNIRSNPDDIA